jgi:hypothetical protein
MASQIMSLMKKVLPYKEYYEVFKYKELKMIYERRNMFGGDNC